MYYKSNQAFSDECVSSWDSTVNLTGKAKNIKLRQEANTVYGYVREIIWYMEI